MAQAPYTRLPANLACSSCTGEQFGPRPIFMTCNLGQSKWKIKTTPLPFQWWRNGAFWLWRKFVTDSGGGVVSFPNHSFPHVNYGKMVHFGCSVSSSLIRERGGFISYFILSKIAILHKINEKLRPPLPQLQWWKKWCVLVVTQVHHWFGGRGGFISYFILTKIALLDKINEKLRPPLPPF